MTSAFDKDLTSRYPALSATGTGSLPKTSIARVMVCELDQYEVVLALSEDDRVLGVMEVRQKKDFRNIQQRVRSTGYIDVEQYIKD
jgi:hypothetical protein